MTLAMTAFVGSFIWNRALRSVWTSQNISLVRGVRRR
jgi:hypothetical protein